MKKYFPLVMAVFLFTLLFTTPVLAANTQWQLQLKDDNQIVERISFAGQAGLEGGLEWKQSEKNGVLVLEREVNNWQDYNRLAEKLPIEAKVKNYIVLQRPLLISIRSQANLLFSVNYLQWITEKLLFNCRDFLVRIMPRK